MPKQNKANFKKVFSLLEKNYPDAKCALFYRNSLELLVATILSAQCTDVRVNIVTPILFEKYRTALDFAKADLNELQNIIRSTGFYRNKAKNIQGACQMILEKFDGEVPRTMEELLKLPGVARKTANVVLWNAYGKNEGVVVDTHVKRLSDRLGFTTYTDPTKIEKDLIKIAPKNDWGQLSHLLIEHGRKICKAQRPLCEKCFLNKLCPYGKKFLKQ